MGLSLVEQLTEEERQFKRFRVKGTSDVLVAGNLRSGLTVNVLPAGGGETEPSPPFTPPCCPNATFVCDQISVSKSKCGYRTDSSSTQYFLSLTATASESWDVPSIFGGRIIGTSSLSISDTLDYLADCDPDPPTPGGTIHSEETDSLGCIRTLVDQYVGGTISDFCGGSPYTNASWSVDNYFKDGSCNPSGDTHFSIIACPIDAAAGLALASQVFNAVNSSFSSFGTITYGTTDITQDTGVGTITTNLTDEYTSDMLHAAAIAALPEYDDDFDDPCLASYELSEDEVDLTISRFRYKFVFESPLEKTCKICWIERTFDSDGNPISDSVICETVPAGSSESSVHECLEPDENGTREIIYPIGPCCTDGVCSITDETTCTDGGGEYQGDSCLTCDPDPCV